MKTTRRQRRYGARHDGKFSTRLRRLRNLQGFTQTEVADLAGVGIRTYREWESGRAVAQPGPALRSVAMVYRVTPGFLLLGDEEGMHAER